MTTTTMIRTVRVGTLVGAGRWEFKGGIVDDATFSSPEFKAQLAEARAAGKRVTIHRVDPECSMCMDNMDDSMLPSHYASSRCRSNGYNHCTCDTCY